MSVRNAIIWTLGGVAALLAALGIAGPWALYGFGLYGIDGRPEPSSAAITLSESECLWKRARGLGTPKITALTPYRYLQEIFRSGRVSPELLVASWIARDFNLHHLKYQRGWPLSDASLTIWVTRNWATEQVMAKAAEIERQRAHNEAHRTCKDARR